MVKKRLVLSRILPFVAVVAWLIAMVLTKFYSQASYAWISLGLYLFSVYCVVWQFVLSRHQNWREIGQFLWPQKWAWLLVGVAALAIGVRLWQLVNYPFVSVGDELRESGLYAMQMAHGERTDFFKYGAYDGYGMIVPAIGAGFYQLFGSSVLTYRLPAALLGILDVFLVYVIVLLVTKKSLIAAFGSLFLATLPLHLFYSRTEVVVMSSSTFTLILLWLWYRVKQAVTIPNLLMMAVTLGFSLGFYAALRPLVFIILGFLLLEIIYSNFKLNIDKSSKNYLHILNKTVCQLSLVGLFMLIGFGPRLWFTTEVNFFHPHQVPLLTHQSKIEAAQVLAQKYWQSLRVWYDKPTANWYPDHRPMVLPIFTLLLVLGVIAAIKKTHAYLISLVVLGLFIHLTNSALTDIVNADHRLAPLYGLGAILIAVGLSEVADLTSHWFGKQVLFWGVGMICVWQLASFFMNQPLDKEEVRADYVSMHIIYELQRAGLQASEATIQVSPTNYLTFNTRHHQEQYAYFFPRTVVKFEELWNLDDREAVVLVKQFEGFMQDKAVIVPCQSFTCPMEWKEVTIFLKDKRRISSRLNSSVH